MSKNTRWSEKDLQKKGLVQNDKGDFVQVSSLVAKGKVDKIEPQIHEEFSAGTVTRIDKIEGHGTTLTIEPPKMTEDADFMALNQRLLQRGKDQHQRFIVANKDWIMDNIPDGKHIIDGAILYLGLTQEEVDNIKPRQTRQEEPPHFDTKYEPKETVPTDYKITKEDLERSGFKFTTPPQPKSDLQVAMGWAMMAGVDPHDKAIDSDTVSIFVKDNTGVVRYIGRPYHNNDIYFTELLDQLKNYYDCDILEEGDFFTLPNGERIKVKQRFDIQPCPAPRMVRSDKWKVTAEKGQRKVVANYFAWRDAFRILCAQQHYKLEERLHCIFIFPIPAYIGKKKRADMMGKPHRQRPDWDNCAKSIMDSFGVDDGYVWDGRGIKLWGEKGEIIILK